MFSLSTYSAALAICTITQLTAATLEPHKIALYPWQPSLRTSFKRRDLSGTSSPLADYFLGTDLQWYGNISVGTPPQTIPVLFDTGSSTIEFASTLCGQSCANQTLFDPSKSSTFLDLHNVRSLVFSTGLGVDPVVGDNYRLVLRGAMDQIGFGNLPPVKVPLFLITEQTSKFGGHPFSGIFGLSATGEGLLSSLISQGLPSLFGMYLTPFAVGNSEIMIGGIDGSKFEEKPIFAPLPPESGSTWQLFSSSLSVNGKTTVILNAPRTVIFDSGTSNILFPSATAHAIYSLVSPDIQPFSQLPGTYGIPCDRVSSLSSMIEITFTSEAGKPFNLTIPTSELSVGPFKSNPSICQTLINAFDGYELSGRSLIGGSLLKHYYSIWDIGGRRLGFAPSIKA
ncbi:acid protease [Crepidotus variabilis]|uniref:Acid protease n=1 Tax=Crepidotus variabilis TaxID=179855 RepID=A0A9P6E7N3_9AGAR|nr:acid protease [Crepidotus variabilis]